MSKITSLLGTISSKKKIIAPQHNHVEELLQMMRSAGVDVEKARCSRECIVKGSTRGNIIIGVILG